MSPIATLAHNITLALAVQSNHGASEVVPSDKPLLIILVCTCLPVCSLYHQFTGLLCEQRENSLQGIPVVKTAVERFRKSTGHLTALHSDLIQVNTVNVSFPVNAHLFVVVFVVSLFAYNPQLCLVAKNVKPALPFLNQAVTALQDEVGLHVNYN